MQAHSSINVVDVPVEQPFEEDPIIVDGVKTVVEKTPDGDVPVFNLLPSTNSSHVLPMSDMGSYPKYLNVFEIISQPALREYNSLDLTVNKLKRPYHFAKLFSYVRPNFVIRLDVRAPIGANYQIKVFAKPPLPYSSANAPGEEKNYPGITFWVSEKSTTYYRINYALPNYCISDFSTIIASFNYNVISQINRTTNPNPLKVTISCCIPELNPAVPRAIFTDNGIPINAGSTQILARGSPSTIMVDGEPRAGWVWEFISMGIALLAESIFPGSGTAVKSTIDFIVILVDGFTDSLLRESQPYSVGVGDYIEYLTDDDGNLMFRLHNSGLNFKYPLTYNVNGSAIPIKANGSQFPISGSLYEKSTAYSTGVLVPMIQSPTGANGLRWPNFNPNASSIINVAKMVGVLEAVPASGAGPLRFNPLAESPLYNFPNHETGPLSIKISISGFSEGTNFSQFPLRPCFALYSARSGTGWKGVSTTSNIAVNPSNFHLIRYQTGETTHVTTFGCYDGGSIASSARDMNAFAFDPTTRDLVLLSKVEVSNTTNAVTMTPLWFPANWWGNDSTGAYLGVANPMMLFGGGPCESQDRVRLASINSVNMDISSPGNVYRYSFNYHTPSFPSTTKKELPSYQSPNQPAPVSTKEETGVKVGNTDKDAGAASVDVSAVESPGTISNPAPEKSARPLGSSVVDVQAEKEIMIPFWTMDVVADLRVASRISPISWNKTGSTRPSHAQVEALRHAYVGPKDVSSQSKFCTYKVTSVANAFVNGRLIIAQVPPIYTQDQVTAMSVEDLSQFNRKEHVLHGPETIIEAEWMLPMPVMDAYSIDSFNGYIVVHVLEFTQSTDTTNARFTLWVRPSNCTYTIPVAPRSYIPPSFSNLVAKVSPKRDHLLRFLVFTDELDEDEKSLVSKIDHMCEKYLFKRGVFLKSLGLDQFKKF